MKEFDYTFIVICLILVFSRIGYNPEPNFSGWLDKKIFHIKTMFFTFVIYLLVLVPPQISFIEMNQNVPTLLNAIISLIYVLTPYIFGVMIWERKPIWLIIYFPMMYGWLVLFRNGY
jgi:hypothetical protein